MSSPPVCALSPAPTSLLHRVARRDRLCCVRNEFPTQRLTYRWRESRFSQFTLSFSPCRKHWDIDSIGSTLREAPPWLQHTVNLSFCLYYHFSTGSVSFVCSLPLCSSPFSDLTPFFEVSSPQSSPPPSCLYPPFSLHIHLRFWEVLCPNRFPLPSRKQRDDISPRPLHPAPHFLPPAARPFGRNRFLTPFHISCFHSSQCSPLITSPSSSRRSPQQSAC